MNCLEMLLLVFVLYAVYKKNNLEFMADAGLSDSKLAKINNKVASSSNKQGDINVGSGETVSGVNQNKQGTVTQTAPKSDPKKKSFKKKSVKKPAGGANDMLMYIAIAAIIYYMMTKK